MIRIIGDVHGGLIRQPDLSKFLKHATKIVPFRFFDPLLKLFQVYNVQKYLKLVKGCEKTIQLGDFGYADEWSQLTKISARNHRILPGNHDNYDICTTYPHCTGDYGTSLFNFPLFYLRGALSIDYTRRTLGVDWWKNEELSYSQLLDAVSLYEKTKPEIVLTHDVTNFASTRMFTPLTVHKSRTVQALNSMYEFHQPRLWIFGHWHQTSFKQIGRTMFVCLGELDYVDIYENRTVAGNIDNIVRQIKSKR